MKCVTLNNQSLLKKTLYDRITGQVDTAAVARAGAGGTGTGRGWGHRWSPPNSRALAREVSARRFVIAVTAERAMIPPTPDADQWTVHGLGNEGRIKPIAASSACRGLTMGDSGRQNHWAHLAVVRIWSSNGKGREEGGSPESGPRHQVLGTEGPVVPGAPAPPPQGVTDTKIFMK